MSFFQKKLEDVIRGARLTSGDIGAYNSQVLQEIKDELKSKEPDAKGHALLKLFYFYHEGANIDWASFHILEGMSSNNPYAKKVACILGSIVLQNDPNAIIMSTSLFQKGIKSNDVKDVSLLLTSLSGVRNKDLGQEVLNSVLNNTFNSKPLIRKKAYACLRTIFDENPSVIAPNLEKILAKFNDEKDNNVLATMISTLFTVIEKQPQLHPMMIKPLYSVLEGKKSNWVTIKLIKIFDQLIILEPRLKKKLADLYLKLMASSNAKSLEYELITTVFNHFADYSDLYSRACQLLKSFIDSNDPNLKGMGLQSLKKLLHNDPKLIHEYYDFLLECYVRGDRINKMTISEIFADFLDEKSVEEAVNLMIKDVKANYKTGSSVMDIIDLIIQNILRLCSKNYYANVSDPDWFLLDVLLVILPIVKNVKTTQLAIDILLDFTLRVEEIRDTAIEFGTKLLTSLESGDISFRSFGQSPFLFEYEIEEERTPSVALKVIEALLFMFGEYANHIKGVDVFLSIVKTLEKVDPKILIDVIGPLEVSLAKLIISLAEFLTSEKIDETILEDGLKELGLSDELPSSKIPRTIIEAYTKRCIKLFFRSFKIGQGNISFLRNYYFYSILNIVDPQLQVLRDEENLTINDDTIKQMKFLKDHIFHKMKPIQKNAQSLVKIPEAVQKLNVELSPHENEMLQNFDEEINKIVKTVAAKAEEEHKEEKRDTDQRSTDTSDRQNEASKPDSESNEVKPRVKKEFKVRVEEDTPNQQTSLAQNLNNINCNSK